MRVCRQDSDCTPTLCYGWSCVITGLALISIIPLSLGLMGKYHAFSMSASLSKGLILSGSMATAFVGLVSLCGTSSWSAHRRDAKARETAKQDGVFDQ